MALTYKFTDNKVQTILPYVKKYSKMYGVPIPLILSVIEKESGFNRTAGSSAGARGYMQLLPKYFSGDLYNTDNNIKQGVKYLADNIIRFHGNIAWALAAYNAGPPKMGALYKAGKPIPSYTATPYITPILKRLPYWQKTCTPKQKRNQVLAVIASAAIFVTIFWYIEV